MAQAFTAGLLAASLLAAAAPASAQPAAPARPAPGLLVRLEAVVLGGDAQALEPLLAPQIDRAALDEFSARWLVRGITRATLRERDRATTPTGQQVVVEAFLETGLIARIATWRLDLVDAGEAGILIAGLKTLSSLEGLYRLELDETRQFQVTNLRIAAEDVELLLPRGSMFVAATRAGVTALVLLGRGEMVFRPGPETERGQVRLFAGDDTLRSPFDGAFVRLHPSDYLATVNPESLSTVPVDARVVKDAQSLFREEAAKSYSVDLADLSQDNWWLMPTAGDLLAEVRTRRFGTITYAHAANDAEDISVFDRVRRRNISVYASKARLAARGPFYNEDDLVDYDVLDYNVDVSYAPDRVWFDGRARLRLRVRAPALTSLSLKLASSLVVRSVTSEEHGRLLFLRVRHQDSLVVNLPATLTRDTEFTVTVSYSGRLDPQRIDSDALGVQRDREPERRADEAPATQPAPSYLYSNRSYWYPQPAVSDYATATIRLTLPPAYGAICSGDAAAGSPVALKVRGEPRTLHVFGATQPVRYLGCVVARLTSGETRVIPVLRPEGSAPAAARGRAYARYDELRIAVKTSPRQRSRANALLERAADIASFYAGVVQDVPYPSFTLGVVESHLPGGHSPAYFAALNQPLPSSPFTWRDDPASFDNFPEFFLAHELAHQWWGQGVGWQNYHEQWLSEGFAQYFAALYAERRRGPDVFGGIIRTMSRWAVSMSDQGPVYLGYRLGHIRNDGRITRALVYNKGAMVLHMLRRLVGDEVFFRAIRRFYVAHRFEKTGTDALREAFSAESGRDFTRFFEQWIYGADLPAVRWTTRTEGQGADQVLVVRIEQGERVFDFPLTVTLQLADGTQRDVVVPVTEKVVEHRVPYTGSLRGVQINRDRAALIRDKS